MLEVKLWKFSIIPARLLLLKCYCLGGDAFGGNSGPGSQTLPCGPPSVGNMDAGGPPNRIGSHTGGPMSGGPGSVGGVPGFGSPGPSSTNTLLMDYNPSSYVLSHFFYFWSL